LALLFNEVYHVLFRRTVQTIVIFPNFLSWVVFGGIMLSFLVPNGPIPKLVEAFGVDGSSILTTPGYFRPIIVVTSILKSAGFASIVYLAAISSINPALFEAARIDGANRWKQMLHITLPSIRPIIIILMILEIGHMMNAGFEQIFILYNPTVYETGDIIDTYVYRMGLENAQYSIATAIGLFKGVVGFILLASANYIVKRTGEQALW
jgi:putative aldouronate transport system permease protein